MADNTVPSSQERRLSRPLENSERLSLSISDQQILAARPARQRLAVDRPQAFFVEPEFSANGYVEDVATVFLTNRECPFRCLMCDLWKGTTEERVSIGAIPTQIDFALERLPVAQHIKLYNAGNFFDTQAIPAQDHSAIAARCASFKSVIVENHPLLTTPRLCLPFRDLLNERGIEFEIAMGLETIHPEILPLLNKQMTTTDFERAAKFATNHGIRCRAFVLLKPPLMDESEAVEWAFKSIQFAFDVGVECCSVIPVRAGNGIMDMLANDGRFSPPSLHSMHELQERALSLNRGRVFMDLWDARNRPDRSAETNQMIDRMQRMNLTQRVQT